VITDGKTSDIEVARRLELPAGSIVVFDRAYNDYLWFTELTLFDVGFVSRMKAGSLYEVVESRTPHGKGVLRDQIITIKTKHAEVDERPYHQRWQIELFFKAIK